MKFSLENADHYFINSAYLSELWASNDLREKVNLGFIGGPQVETQIEDEMRHARDLKKAMIEFGYMPIEDLKYSMQNVIYKKLCALDLSQCVVSQEVFWGMHEIMERRAIWNYRTYLAGGKHEIYKIILRKIIKDERYHFKKILPNHPIVKAIHELDKWVYKTHLYQNYNKMNLLSSIDFWTHYYGRGLN